MPGSPTAREPFLWVALIALTTHAIVLHQKHSRAVEVVLDLRDRARWHMEPLIQRYPRAPDVTWFAGISCVTSDCAAEVAGWRWAVTKGVTYQGECYGDNSAYDLGIVDGCEAYIEVMHYPKLPDV